MELGAATHVGLMRHRNEDAYHVDPGRGLALVADGLGGHPAGDVAAELAAETIAGELTALEGTDPAAALVRALEQANEVVVKDALEHLERRGMATTAVVALAPDADSGAWVAHVGDSRAYLVRDGRLVLLTEDHTTGGVFGRGQITQALGAPGGVEPDCAHLDLEPGDRLMLCSDGLTDMVDETTIAEIAAADAAPQEACDALVAAALDRGGVDNVTVVVADAGG